MPRRFVTALIALALLAPAGARAADKKGASSYLELPTVAASIVRATGRRGVLTVEVGVDIPDPALRSKASLSAPRLRDAFVSALQPYALGLSPGAPPSADYISMALQHETDRVLGRTGARLLLGSILIN